MTKVIPLAQLALLEKCLGMLGSDQDGEVLNAARKSAKILKDHGFTWAELLRKQVSVDFEPAPASGDDRAQMVAATNAKVQTALDTLRGVDIRAKDFIASLDEQWSRKNYLSINQRSALFNTYDRYKRDGK